MRTLSCAGSWTPNGQGRHVSRRIRISIFNSIWTQPGLWAQEAAQELIDLDARIEGVTVSVTRDGDTLTIGPVEPEPEKTDDNTPTDTTIDDVLDGDGDE